MQGFENQGEIRLERPAVPGHFHAYMPKLLLFNQVTLLWQLYVGLLRRCSQYFTQFDLNYSSHLAQYCLLVQLNWASPGFRGLSDR